MRKRILLAAMASALVVLSPACNKKAADASVKSSDQPFNGVQFLQDFESAPPELNTLANNAWRCIQSGAFTQAAKLLSQLESNPSLNEAQKKSTAQVADQVRTWLAANPGTR